MRLDAAIKTAPAEVSTHAIDGTARMVAEGRGEVVRARRKALGLTQAELADILRTNTTAICALERGACTHSEREWERMTALYQRVDQMLTELEQISPITFEQPRSPEDNTAAHISSRGPASEPRAGDALAGRPHPSPAPFSTDHPDFSTERLVSPNPPGMAQAGRAAKANPCPTHGPRGHFFGPWATVWELVSDLIAVAGFITFFLTIYFIGAIIS